MTPLRILALIAASGGIQALAGQPASLVDASPFLPSATVGAPAAPHAEALELRGIMPGASGYLFYVYDTAKKRGVWAGTSDPADAFTVVEGNAREGSLDIRTSDGQLLHLKLREAKILPGGNSNAAASVGVVSSAARPGGHRIMTESQAEWQEEVRRRQAENAASD
jgi:hypothetical protein